MTAQVRLLDGRFGVWLDDRAALEELQAVLHQLNMTQVWRGRLPIESAVSLVRATRALIALVDASQVPAAEPTSDAEVPVEASWITTEETARLLGIGPRAVRKRVATGTLQGRKVGGILLINSKEMAADAA